jgi:alpha-mannosidase
MASLSADIRLAHAMRYFVVPHTHWDREWYRPLEHFRLMLGRVVDGVLDTLERDQSFTSFTLDGQAIVLEDYVEVRPEHEGRLRALIAAGRIEIGPSYVLPDEFLVGGESLVRNLLIGRAVCARFGGRPSPAGYLPDSFGHPLQLPQILAGFGIDSFLFSRGLGDEFDDLGVAFNWLAPDGSSVRALQLLGDYSNFAHIADDDDAERRVLGVHERFGQALDRCGATAVVLCNGTDHWSIQPQMPAVCAELERRFDGSSFEIAQYGDYVSALTTEELPSFEGELLGSRLWNVLRGVNSARLYIKQANEHAEQRLLAVETLAALKAVRLGLPFPVADFTFAWKELLKCHPHDSICGCSCDEVHRDMLDRYASLERTLCWLAADALEEFPPGEVGVINPLPFRRSGLVVVDGGAPRVVELDGFSARTVTAGDRTPDPPPDPAPPRDGARIENDRFSVELADDGTLTVESRRSGRRFEGLHAIEDELDMGDLYNFCPVDGTGVWRCRDAASRILSDGPVCSELEVRYEGERPVGLDSNHRVMLSVRTVVRLVRGCDRIEFETTVDNAGQDHRLRVLFPVGKASGPVRAEGQFAVVHRPLIPPEPRAQWCEPPDRTQHTVGAVALGHVALLTRGLPEYEARTRPGGTELCLTLLRCVGLISRPSGTIPTRPLGAGPQTPTPEGQCLGRHTLEYALRFDAACLDDVELVRASQDYRSPFLVVPASVEFDAPITVEGNVVVSCLKGAESGDGLILRVFNPGAEAARTRIRGPVAIERVRLDEGGGTAVEDGLIDVSAGQIATVRVRAR